MQSYTFRTVIAPDENGTFHGYAPALQGCHTWGDSLEATRRNLRDAITAYVASMIEDGEEVPGDIGYETLETVTIGGANPSYA
ncbi:type II toxin-antitoxin system HicB family antitoxin [Candidatus Uhrbacteria bacterium]|nr:type II toxin-antitoxin system HicB family antitoxin [Candidatus Uhrbacteria bacterium]